MLSVPRSAPSVYATPTSGVPTFPYFQWRKFTPRNLRSRLDSFLSSRLLFLQDAAPKSKDPCHVRIVRREDGSFLEQISSCSNARPPCSGCWVPVALE